MLLRIELEVDVVQQTDYAPIFLLVRIAELLCVPAHNALDGQRVANVKRVFVVFFRSSNASSLVILLSLIFVVSLHFAHYCASFHNYTTCLVGFQLYARLYVEIDKRALIYRKQQINKLIFVNAVVRAYPLDNNARAAVENI